MLAAASPQAADAQAPVAREPDPGDLNAYKVVVAEKVVKHADKAVKANAKRPNDATINGLTVIGAQIRANGTAERLWVVRSSSKPQLDQLAMDSIVAAQPLPLPPEKVLVGRSYVIFAESFIHRNDGKFQLISKTTR